MTHGFPKRPDLSPFWRFQIAGWATYVLLSFPFKLVIFGSFGTALFVTATRDVLVFILSYAMREIYRRLCGDLQRILRNLLVGLVVSSFSGLILTGFSYILYEHCGIQDEVSKILKTGIRTFYIQVGLCCRIDAAARIFPVPSVILQPLVENAIKYGRQTIQSFLLIRINVQSLDPGTVQIKVANTGKWVEPAPQSSELRGLGLDNLKRRLAFLYPGLHEFDVTAEYGWVTVRLKIQSPTHKS